MSDHGGSRTPSQASNHSSLGIFEDETNAEAFIQSLISSSGLQDFTKRQHNRVGGVEKFMTKLKERVDMIVTHYVPREEYAERVETYHDGKITEFGENINSLQDIQTKLTTSTEGSENDIKALQDRVTSQESLMNEAKQALDELESRYTQQKKDTVTRIAESKGDLQGQADHIRVDISDLTAALKEQVANQQRNMEEFRNLKDYMMGEGLQKQVTQLVDDRLRGYVNDERMPEEQQKILAMVEETFIEKVRADLQATNHTISELNGDVKIKDARIHQIAKMIESSLGQLSEKQMRDHANCCEELEVRSTISQLEDAETRLHNTIIQSKTDVDTLRNRCLSKLNEFVDHHAAIRGTLQDHEHCLSHHAEELENRPTKYELLIAQNRVDKCVTKDKYEREVDEMKRILDWQTTKIEAYGMNSIKGRKTKYAAPPTFASGDGGAGRETARRGSEDSNMELDDDEAPPVQVLHRQLECLSMGVIGLSSLCLLKEPGTGASRQKRLAQEMDILGHLKNLRHWITHRQAPGGWDPKRMATVALRIGNANPPTLEYPKDDTGSVLPQLRTLTTRPETPRSQAIAAAEGKVGNQASMQSTHMTSLDSVQSSTTWPESSRTLSRHLPAKSSREQAYARIAANSSTPPPGNHATRQKHGRPNPMTKGKPVKKNDPEDFSGLFLEASGPQGQVSAVSTAEGFAEVVSEVVSAYMPSPATDLVSPPMDEPSPTSVIDPSP